MKIIYMLMALALLVAACAETKTEAEYLADAQLSIDNGDVAAAIIEVKNALKLNANNSEARFLLGKLHLESGNPSAAEKELLAAQELGVPADLIVPYLSQALLQQRKLEALKKLSVGSLDATKRAEVLANQGLAFLSDRDMGQATNLIQEAASLAPDSILVQLAQARLQLATRDFSKVRATLDAVLENASDNASAWSLMGELERFEGNLGASEVAFTKAVDNNQTPFLDVLKRAEVRIQLKKYEAAQKDLDVVLKQSPNHPLANFSQGQIHLANKNIDEAIASFGKSALVQPDFAPVLFALATTHYQKGNFAQSEQYAYKYLAQDPDSVPGARFLGAVLFQNGKLTEAEEQMKYVLTRQPDDPLAMNVLSSIMFKSGKEAESVKLLEKIASSYPDSAFAQLRLGAGLMAGGKAEQGQSHMEKAIALNPELHQAQVMLIMHHILQKDYEHAQILAEQYRENNPTFDLPHSLLGQVLLLRDDVDGARQSFEKAVEINPGSAAANSALAMLAIRDKKPDQARSYYQNILKYKENDLRTLMRLAALDGMEEKFDAMASRLERVMKAHPSALQPRVVMGRYLLTQNEAEKVPGLFQGLNREVSQSPDALSVMGTAQLEMKQFADARLTLRDLETLKPNSAPVHYLLARAYAGEKKWLDMEKSLRKAVELRPDFYDARLSLASYLVNVDPKQARDQLGVLKEMKPNDPQVVSLDAIVQNKLGDPKKALGVYEKAFKDVPATQNLLLLVRQHVYMKNRDKAVSLLESWLASNPDDVEARLFLANEYLVLKKPSKDIIGQYQKVLELQPNNVMALNNLAWNLMDAEPKRALDIAQQATQLQPKAVSVMDTLAVVQMKNALYTQAKETIRRALIKMPENPTVRYHAAMIDHAAGDPLAAYEKLSVLLQEEKEFPQRDEALKLMQSIK